MATTPQYAATLKTWTVKTSGALGGTIDVPTGTVSIGTIGATGSRIERIIIKAISTTQKGMLRFYIYSGAVYYLWKEIPVPVVNNNSGAATTFSAELASEVLGSQLPLLVASGATLHVGSTTTDVFHITAFGGDL